MTVTSGSELGGETPWLAAWCWPTLRSPRPWNSYVYFRLSVNLPARPTAAQIRVSADSRYTLYVNGRRVHQGPARCRPESQSYDELNLADLLHGGPNAICAVVHQFGVPTAQSAYRDASGFILDGSAEIDGQAIDLGTPGAWVCREAAGWRKHVERLSADLGFQEHFDADADPAGWMTAEYEATAEAGWRAPVVVAPAGGYPWVQMKPRGVPLLVDQVTSFTGVVAQFTGENARGYKVAEDVFKLAQEETRKKARMLIENVEAMLRDDDQAGAVVPPADGQFHMAVLDLGQVRIGHVILDIMEAAGDEIIDVIYSTRLDKSQAPLMELEEGAERWGGLADRYRCRPGPQRWEFYSARGFRYATLVFRNVEAPLRIRHAGVRVINAAVEWVGTFSCNDAELTAIYQAGVATLRGCLLDGYLECPERSQAQRWPAIREQFNAGTGCFPGTAHLERAIELAAESQGADGSLHAMTPADQPQMRRVDGMFAWIGALHDLRAQTGRMDLLRRCRGALARLLEFFARHEKHDGLIGGLEAFEVGLESGGSAGAKTLCAAINLSYLQALRWAAHLLRAIGDSDEAIIARAEALAQGIEKHFWDAKAKLWRDGIDAKTLLPIDSASVQVNAMAVLLNLLPETRDAVAKEVVLKNMLARRSGKIVAALPGQSGLVLNALLSAGLAKDAIEVIKSRWGPMVEGQLPVGSATFWEEWDGVSGSRCFGAACAPVAVLGRQILGIWPAGEGWSKVRIAPLVGELEFARGSVATPLGPVRVEWEKAGDDQLAVRVELPEGMTGEFVGPGVVTRELCVGASEFHT